MGSTNGVLLPIPELTESADGPKAVSDLANGVEDYFYDRILPTGVTRYPPHFWGSGTSFPTAAVGAKVGDTYIHTGLGGALLAYLGIVGTTPVWRQLDPPTRITNAAARTTMSTNYSTVLPVSFTVIEIDTNRTYRWEGTLWRKLAGGLPELIANNSAVGSSGSPPVGVDTAVRSISVPAHTPGILRVQSTGIWSCATGQAVWNQLTTPAGSVEGSSARTHNGKNASVESGTSFATEGYVDSNGGTFILTLMMRIEANISTIIVEASFRIWLL